LIDAPALSCANPIDIGFGDHNCAADQSKCGVAKNRKSTLVIFKFQMDFPSFFDVLDPLAEVMCSLPGKIDRYVDFLFFTVAGNSLNRVRP
jgi:hypothetical protein